MTRRAACLVCLALAGGCTPQYAPKARKVGQVLAIAGVVGLVATVAAAGAITDEEPLLVGFSVMSFGGILTFAAGELSEEPRGGPPETESQKLERWARTLTTRAAGAAREGRCHRVRKYERRVHLYDREVHDFVFMRDPEIQRCLGTLADEPRPATPIESDDPPPRTDPAATPHDAPAPSGSPPAPTPVAPPALPPTKLIPVRLP